jgi:hypothetical protein
MKMPLPPRATPTPPPWPEGKQSVDGLVPPLKYPVFLDNPEDPGLHSLKRAIDLPALPPPMGGSFWDPLRPVQDGAPAAADN